MKANKYWNEPQFGNIPEDWVKVYTVAIANLPLIPNRKVKDFINWITKMEGFIGIRPEYPYGTLLLFDTENHAKACKNLIPTYKYGYQGGIGHNISECFIPPEYAKKEQNNG